ncbi:helix-turn-helix transcriptional regulator [Flavobacterium sp.]|uniref:helix-turn-helix domain-containing protein n=1 Tax=Flavobacterium sp. TaxID=239 RepID=UPI00286A2970|nr:helix-turn-helix transcriptional regulator [Flavobacterium sp.]
MKLTVSFRNQLGLSQEMMAIYLAVAKSQLSMYESGKRELPTASLVKLADIALLLQRNESTAEAESELQKAQEVKLKTFLDFQINELEYKKLKEQRLLERIQKKYKQNVQLYSFAQHLQNSKTALAEVLLQQAIKGIEQNGLVNQTIQKMKLEIITSQLDSIHLLKKM